MARTSRHVEHKLDRIQVRLWPRRGIGRSREADLASWLDDWRDSQLWEWSGEALAGEMQTEAEFGLGDVVDHLCVMSVKDCLARIDLSHPYAEGQQATAWLRVHRSHGALPALCGLYEDRLLSAEAVVQALGGFVKASASEQTRGMAASRPPPI